MTITFSDLGVPEDIASRLARRGRDAPFDIQALTVPDSLRGLDVSGKAPTGSGKTIAFGIPLAAGIRRSAPKRPKGLVLAPTRELAGQIADELRELGDQRVLAVYGGAPIAPQMKKLRAGVDIVVACPGRLLDVMERGACDLRDVEIVVLDEADRMADMGFLPSVRRILDATPADRQTLLFSATLDGAVDSLVSRYQREPVVHELAEEERGPVDHHLWSVADRAEKVQLTAKIVERVGSTIVFSRTRHGADRLARQLDRLGVPAAAIHGNRSQNQRERALAAFHSGAVRALVATDVAARGIHVEDVRCVVHFDLPADPKDYVHRSGRTGRAGGTGTVVGLVPVPDRRAAEKLLRAAGAETRVADADLDAIPLGPAGERPDDRRGDRSDGSGRSERDSAERRTHRGHGGGGGATARSGDGRGGSGGGRVGRGGGGGSGRGRRSRGRGAGTGGPGRGRSGEARSGGGRPGGRRSGGGRSGDGRANDGRGTGSSRPSGGRGGNRGAASRGRGARRSTGDRS